jgi:hypothetical protein
MQRGSLVSALPPLSKGAAQDTATRPYSPDSPPYFHANYIVAATRPEHRPFYQRVLGCELHSDLQPAPHRTGRVGLVTLDFATSAKVLYENLPFLRSTAAERERLFERK